MAQFKLLELIAKAAQDNVQFFIETHSDCFLNSARLKAKELKINHFFQIYYIKKNKDDESIIKNLNMTHDGQIDWPSGLFDQNEKILKEFYGF